MRNKEIPCYEGLKAILDCVSRQTALLQNLAETSPDCPGWADANRQKIRGLASAAHREWREMNERLARVFISPVDREDLSALAREGMELADDLALTAALWLRRPPEQGAAWADRLAAGIRALLTLTEELPRIRGDNALAPRAGALYAWRRDADRAFEEADPVPSLLALYGCCRRLARMGDTLEWIKLKNG